MQYSSYALQYYLTLYQRIQKKQFNGEVHSYYLYNQNSDKQTEIDPPLEDDANDHFFLFGIQE